MLENISNSCLLVEACSSSGFACIFKFHTAEGNSRFDVEI
jgi:hypothetical protein